MPEVSGIKMLLLHDVFGNLELRKYRRYIVVNY